MPSDPSSASAADGPPRSTQRNASTLAVRPPPLMAPPPTTPAGSCAVTGITERNFASFRGMSGTQLCPIEILSRFARKCCIEGSEERVRGFIVQAASQQRQVPGRHGAQGNAKKMQFARTIMNSLRKDVVPSFAAPMTPASPSWFGAHAAPTSTTQVEPLARFPVIGHGDGTDLATPAEVAPPRVAGAHPRPTRVHLVEAEEGEAAGPKVRAEGGTRDTEASPCAYYETHLETILHILFEAATTAARIQYPSAPACLASPKTSALATRPLENIIPLVSSDDPETPSTSTRPRDTAATRSNPMGTPEAPPTNSRHAEIMAGRVESIRLFGAASPSRSVPAHREDAPKFATGLSDDDGASATSVASVLFRQPANVTRHAEVGSEGDDGTFEVNQYILLAQIGAGRQGEVWIASDTSCGEMRAVKIVRRPKHFDGPHSSNVGALEAAKERKWKQLEREVNVMKRCRHQNLVALYEVIDDPELDRMYLVMQYIEKGPLVKQLPDGTTDRVIEPRKMVYYAKQLCTALHYLHQRGIVHRDIKPDNILLGQNDQVYLADFGMSELFERTEKDDQGHSTKAFPPLSPSVCGTFGTLPFMAPELLDQNAVATGESVDVWALGLSFYVFLFGRLPWTSASSAPLMKEILQYESFVFPAFPSTDSSTVAEQQRAAPALASPDSDEIDASISMRGKKPPLSDAEVRSAWLDLLAGMLHRDTSQRISVAGLYRRVKQLYRDVGDDVSSVTPTSPAAADDALTVLRRRRSSFFTDRRLY